MARFLNFILIKVPNKGLKLTYLFFSFLYINIIRISNNIKIGNSYQFNGFPRFIINLENDEVEWLEEFDQHDEKELLSETERFIKEASEFYDREGSRYDE